MLRRDSLHRLVERQRKNSCSPTDPSSDFHRLSTPTKYLDAIIHKHGSFVWVQYPARSPLCTWTTTVEHFNNVFPPFLISVFSSFHQHHSFTMRRREEQHSYSDLSNRSISSFFSPTCILHDVTTLWVLVSGTGL